ncbi:glycosyl transferase family protein [Paracidovorax oryzae]|uniref:glycosyl transferase family protein n=1 Tax=Paracidovorax oryzae TaxID=862720 RepID=UPI00047E7303|nr:glycosyl transferase family protein [Paracidovorax oryzae]
MSLYWPYFFADYYRCLEILTAVVSVVILLSSIDDLFIDVWYWTRQAYRSVMVRRRYKRLTAQELRDRPEQPMAIMVPAWLEYDVIAPMLSNMVSTLEYKDYTIFVGTYRNDARTIAEVERMRRRYRQLVRVEVPHDGPTCKADCLNWIVQALFSHEKHMPAPFAGVVLHDSEDVLHPLELKYYNYLLPRMDFIQLPVTSLERSWFEIVAGTYMDEFAEWHSKDLVVRESMSSMVPSAGVGTCFSHRALHELSRTMDNQPFNVDSLTEDYDIGTRLSRMGMKQIFGKFNVDYVTRRVAFFGLGREKTGTIQMPLGVREFFPDTFRTAYRQKARWTLGIGLQGWEQVGWSGSLATKYLLFRDRKGLVTSFMAMLGYLLMFNFLLFFIADALGWWTVYYPSVFSPGGWLMTVMGLNAFALMLRVVQRAYFVTSMYGWEHGLLSVPRMIVGNCINAMAAARAWKLFLSNKLFGTRLVWDKTMHDFPSADQLVQRRRRLGEVLLSWRAIDEAHLDQALQLQSASGRPLGTILLENGWLDEGTLEEAISFQREESAHAAEFSHASPQARTA